MYTLFFHLIKKATFGTKLKSYHGYLLLSLQRQAKTSTSSTNKKTISVVPNAPEFVKPHPKQESMWVTVLNNVYACVRCNGMCCLGKATKPTIMNENAT